MQGLRTKIFLTLSDDFSAQMAADSVRQGRAAQAELHAHRGGPGCARQPLDRAGRPPTETTVSAAKTYSLQHDYVFQPKVFAELQNAQAIVLPYDGLNPQPPTYCYLKPDTSTCRRATSTTPRREPSE